MNNQSFSKIWIIIIAVFIVGGILAWQYFGVGKEEVKAPEVKTSQGVIKDKITNWKTYRNEKYGFEFKYLSIPSGCENCKIQESEEGFTVNRTNLSIDDLGKLNLSEFVNKKMGEFEIERKEKMLIGGKEGIKVDYRFGGMERFGSVAFVEKNKKVIIFEFTAGGFCCSPETDRIYESDVYEAMLSTFRFLE